MPATHNMPLTLFDQLLDAPQLWGQRYLGLIPIFTAFGTTGLTFDRGLLLGLALIRIPISNLWRTASKRLPKYPQRVT